MDQFLALLANPVFSGLLGAAVGAVLPAAVALVSALIREHNEGRRFRARAVIRLALYDHRHFHTSQIASAPPLLSFLAHHAAVLDAIEAGKLTPERAAELADESRRLIAQLPKADASTVK